MAGKNGNGKNDGEKPDPLTVIQNQDRSKKMKVFYLNGQLHRTLHIDRSKDRITTWCYPLSKRIAYTYSYTKKVREPAFTTPQVCAMINRHRVTVEQVLLEGKVERPQFSYGLNEARKISKYWWSEENVLELHAYFSSVHRGRPRKDGLISPQKLPSARELRAMMRQEQILYVQNDDGEFVPVWKAQDFN